MELVKFCRRYFQIHFLKENSNIHFWCVSLKLVSKRRVQLRVSIGTGNGFVRNRWQSITSTNIDQNSMVLWCHWAIMSSTHLYLITMERPWALIQVCSTHICMVECTHLITTGGTPHLYDGAKGKMFWWIMKKINFWLWAGWVASYLQRSFSAQVNGGGGPDATPDLWKQPFSAVRASGGYPGNAGKNGCHF